MADTAGKKKPLTGAVVRRLELPGRISDPIDPALKRQIKAMVGKAGAPARRGRPPKSASEY